MAAAFSVPYLGKVPLDPNLLRACEEGVAVADKAPGSPAVAALEQIVKGAWVVGVEMEMEMGEGFGGGSCRPARLPNPSHISDVSMYVITAIVEGTTAGGTAEGATNSRSSSGGGGGGVRGKSVDGDGGGSV